MKKSEVGQMIECRVRASLDLSPRWLPRLLAVAAFALLVIHVTLQTLHYKAGGVHWLLKDAFDVDEEQNIPTWFSAMLLLISALLLFSIARVKREERAAGAGYWKALAIGFVWLSLDEVAGIHEILNTIPDELHSDSGFTWEYVGTPVFVIVGLVFLRFLWQLPKRTRFGMCLAGIIYGSGVLGIEYVCHLYLKSHDRDNLGYNLLAGLEESLEMAGVILFIGVLLSYLETLTTLEPSSRPATDPLT